MLSQMGATCVLLLFLDEQFLAPEEVGEEVGESDFALGVEFALVPQFLEGLLVEATPVHPAYHCVQLPVAQVVALRHSLPPEAVPHHQQGQLGHQQQSNEQSSTITVTYPKSLIPLSSSKQRMHQSPLTADAGDEGCQGLWGWRVDIFQADSILQSLTEIRKMDAILLSVNKGQLNSAESSEDNNRSTVKRLFSSVFSIIDNDQEVTDFSEDCHQSKIERLLDNALFVSHLQGKLRSEGLYEGYHLPIIRIAVAQGGYGGYCELDHEDLVRTFGKFGEVKKVLLGGEGREAFVFFNSFLNAYIAYKMVRSARLRGGSLEMVAEWVQSSDMHPQVAGEVHAFINTLSWESLFENRRTAPALSEEVQVGKQNKLTCRYEIQIENEREFQVARRIIGSKGCNMKRILEDSISLNNENKNYSNDNANELLKLRLRGRGSGYKEGPEQQESNEALHLCVSAKDELVYTSACGKVEKLLASIYSEYSDFTRKQGRMIELSVKRINIGQGAANQEPNPNPSPTYHPQPECYQQERYGMMYRIVPQKITELLQLRNKARRELNFGEADRIRNYLRSCGVCLIDEKGRRGKATEVTTWKYLY